MRKAYDRSYFDRWYRDPSRRVITPTVVARKVRMVTGLAEVLLERPIRSVLDVGCGEGAWRAHLRRLRPRVRYVGVESSDYAVRRFGKARGIVRGSLGSLELEGTFDLIVVCDVLQYVPANEVKRGLDAVASLLGGVAYLEAYTSHDAVDGDRHAWNVRDPSWYRRAFARAGFTAVGMHCYVGAALAKVTGALEKLQV